MAQPCSFCPTVLTEVHILCVDCEPKLAICIRCFSKGAESGTHRNDHRYTVVTTEFPLLCRTWTAAEELKLLDALLDCGIGNWTDVAKQVGTQTARECEAHYLQHYIYAPNHLLKGAYLFCFKSVVHRFAAHLQCHVSVSGDPPRPALCSQQQTDMAGYMPARGDFSCEFDNYAEMDLTDLDFTQCEDDLDRELQLAMVEVYRSRLRERARRKWLVRTHGLVSVQRTSQSWRRYGSTLGERTSSLLARFMQLFPPDEFEFFVEGLHSEPTDSECHISNVHENFLLSGITCCAHLTILASQGFFGEHYHIPVKILNCGWCLQYCHSVYSELFAAYSPVLCTNLNSRRRAPPLQVEGLLGYEKLTPNERELCANLRLVPETYLLFKSLLISEYEKLGCLRLANARAIIKIDVNKTRKIYDFLVAEGVVRKERA
ncbi:transcriptional adaptor, putative [Ixodes scapularis]|uniref:Transcriptional adaptor, putative n=1 Tax=Ixodes scapularis TaxID=6945 RepID=B7PKC8_IXOSC|nr:transcriptional adaptor, putative [Ixodes scapularis]|eukprot:XP_002399622.1 transcriptional adaptor, putative [Ixodes scapularis]